MNGFIACENKFIKNIKDKNKDITEYERSGSCANVVIIVGNDSTNISR